MAFVMTVKLEPIAGGTETTCTHVSNKLCSSQSYTPATNIADGVCDACADGTYSAGGTETTCNHEVTSCAPGQSYTPATNIEDGRCDACCGWNLKLKLHA